ncbi:hypothetical protein [Azospirillum palustre]|uniref:hypothetical protein n=1 Tax=Azospirillum palustre TaxID=2044885 RepID=UPI001178606A|nr:hypothetical protein [Azospirillum palustre]
MDKRLEYLNAWRRYKAAISALEDIKTKLKGASEYVERIRPNVSISSGDTVFRQWPDESKLSKTVKDYYDSVADLVQIWSELPHDLQDGLQSPPR